MADPDARFERLVAVAMTSNIRSPLARYLSAHHDQFDRLLADFRPRWDALVEQWAADGLLTLPPDWNSDDKQVRAVTRQKAVKAARRTWERVKAKKAHPRPSTRTKPVSAEPTVRTTAPPVPHARLPTRHPLSDRPIAHHSPENENNSCSVLPSRWRKVNLRQTTEAVCRNPYAQKREALSKWQIPVAPMQSKHPT